MPQGEKIISVHWDGFAPVYSYPSLSFKWAAIYCKAGLGPGAVCYSIDITLFYSPDPDTHPRWVIDLRFRNSITGRQQQPFIVDVTDPSQIPVVIREIPDLLNRELLEEFIAGRIRSFLAAF